MKWLVILMFVLLIGLATCFREEEKEESVRKKEERAEVKEHLMDSSKDKPQLVVIELGGRQAKPSVRIIEKKLEELQEQEQLEQEDSLRRKIKTAKNESFSGKPSFKMDERTKNVLLGGRSETFFAQKMIDFYLKNPETQLQRQCYADKLKLGDSIDFVIDLAPSPSKDKIDTLLAQSPFAFYLQEVARTPSRAYFGAIEIFIEAVTMDMNPHLTHIVIYDNGQKFYIRGRHVDEVISGEKQDFRDMKRNLLTLWPSQTNTTSESCFRDIVKNNLGHVTKIALWNRANGLPTVLAGSRWSKPVYTIVLTDGASGAKIEELTDDLSRTTVIDLGGRRFIKNLTSNHLRKLAGIYTFPSPQQLPMVIDTCRVLACRLASHR